MAATTTESRLGTLKHYQVTLEFRYGRRVMTSCLARDEAEIRTTPLVSTWDGQQWLPAKVIRIVADPRPHRGLHRDTTGD